MNRFKSIYYTLLVIVGAFLSSCIENDIPYPREQVDFLTIEAEGQSADALIDKEERSVMFTFPENANIGNVKIVSYTLSEGGELKSPDLTQPLNLRENVYVILHKYYDYDWTLKAKQDIERYFTVRNQIGSSTIDAPAKRVVVYIPDSEDLSKVKVESIKLGPAEVSSMTPEIKNGDFIDCTNPLQVVISYFDIKETWTIYVQKKTSLVSTDEVNAWSKVIWAYGTGLKGNENGFEYREAGTEEWIKLPQSEITHNGGSFVGRINNVKEETNYEVRAYSGQEIGSIVDVKTEPILPLPNASLDEWWLDNKVWNPWGSSGVSFWDTGNKGATTLGDSNSVPAAETWNGETGQSAKLETKFVGIGPVGKLAAGNLFTGEFIKVDGTNGILNFGREFTGRPTRLHGYCKYKTAPINYASSNFTHLKGQPDTAIVYMALTDWNEPYEIRTNPRNLRLFDPKAPEVIAYGEVKYGSDVNDFTEFVVDLKYTDTRRVPKYILIVCTASKYGDYFTGGSGSIFHVDNFWFDWKY